MKYMEEHNTQNPASLAAHRWENTVSIDQTKA